MLLGLYPLLGFLMATVSQPALAYETDQLTRRLEALSDAALSADDEANRMLAAAVLRTNEQTGCSSSVRETRRLLAGNIHGITAVPTFVQGRGQLAGLGYGAYGAWLETDPRVDRRSFADADDIYAQVSPGENLVVTTVGVCSTIQLAGILMGTDKPDHFWSQGYEYFRASKRGRHDAAAIRWGTSSERGRYGLLTSGAFSYADIAANWAGYQFYKQLLTESSPLTLDREGCVARAAPFRWVDWITNAVDEGLNPPRYTDAVRDAVRDHLVLRRESICSDYRVWGPVAAERIEAIILGEETQLSSKAPGRVDEWQLEALCTKRDIAP